MCVCVCKYACMYVMCVGPTNSYYCILKLIIMGLSHERIFRHMIRRMSSFSNASRSLYTSFVYAPNTLAYALTTSHTAKPEEEF